MDAKAFANDDKLTREITGIKGANGRPIGIALISPKQYCCVCSGALVLRKDRGASIVVYDERLGPCPGTHFHKICTRKSCTVRQYYGYHSNQEATVVYDDDWKTNQYFVSSSLTAFSVKMLIQIDSQIVFGQLSYKQIADIFNNVHNTFGNVENRYMICI